MSRIAKSLTIVALAASLAACSSVDLNKDANGANSADANGIMDPLLTLFSVLLHELYKLFE